MTFQWSITKVSLLKKIAHCSKQMDRMTWLCAPCCVTCRLAPTDARLKLTAAEFECRDVQCYVVWLPHTHTHSHILTHTHAHTHIYSHAHSRALTHTQTTRAHTHKNSFSHARARAHTHTHSHKHSNTLTLTITHTLTHTHTNAHPHTHTLTHTHTHTHTHTLTHTSLVRTLILFILLKREIRKSKYKEPPSTHLIFISSSTNIRWLPPKVWCRVNRRIGCDTHSFLHEQRIIPIHFLP